MSYSTHGPYEIGINYKSSIPWRYGLGVRGINYMMFGPDLFQNYILNNSNVMVNHLMFLFDGLKMILFVSRRFQGKFKIGHECWAIIRNLNVHKRWE